MGKNESPNFLMESFRLLLFTPSRGDFPNAVNFSERERKISDNLGNLTKDSDGGIVFIFGPWGSGKSTLLSTLIESKAGLFDASIHRVSMHIATSLNEAFLCLIPTWTKIVSLSLLLACLIGAYFLNFSLDKVIESIQESSITVTLSLIMFTLFILVNAYRAFYIFCGLIESGLVALLGIRQVKIVEDFDRSSLGNDGILSCLASRVRTNATFIVPLGYSTTAEQVEYLDIARKLNASIVSLDTHHETLLETAVMLDSNIKFIDSKWMKVFTFREVVNVVSMRKKLIFEMEPRMLRYAYYRIFFNKILQKYGLTTNYIGFSGGNVDSNRIANTDAYRVLSEFIRSIDVNDIRTESSFQNGAGNWSDILLKELLFGEGHFKNVQLIHC